MYIQKRLFAKLIGKIIAPLNKTIKSRLFVPTKNPDSSKTVPEKNEIIITNSRGVCN